MIKVYIDNEEVVSNSNLQIKEEMLSTSSTILKNCYPKSWEDDKDYVSNFYFPKDYSKCKILKPTYHPTIPGETKKGTIFSLNYDNTLDNELIGIYGNTSQDGTPIPTSEKYIDKVSGNQNIEVCGKNLFDKNNFNEVRGTIDAVNNSFTYSSTSVNYCFYISCEPNTTYTIQKRNDGNKNRFKFGSCSTTISTQNGIITNLTTAVSDDNVSSLTITTGANDIYLIAQYYRSEETTLTKQQLLDSIQIEVGSTATEYEAYTGNTYRINLSKNLFDISDMRAKTNCTIDSDGWITATFDNSGGSSTAFANLFTNKSFYLKPNTTYLVVAEVKEITGTLRDLTLSSKHNASQVNTTNTILYADLTPNSVYVRTFTTKSDYTNANIMIRGYVSWSAGQSGSITYRISVLEDTSITPQTFTYTPYTTPIELCKIGNYQDKIYKSGDKWYLYKTIGRKVFNGSETWNTGTNYYGTNASLGAIAGQGYTNFYKYGGTTTPNSFWITTNAFRVYDTNSSNVNNFKTWLSNHLLELYYVLNIPTTTEITDTELINQLNAIELRNGFNNVSVLSIDLQGEIEIHYNYKEAYTSEDLIFCGVVKNTGKISLNPREPHYVDLQILDFKTLLSEGETLNYVINNKTIIEAINQVIDSIADYGFVLGNVNIQNPNDIINAYSTLDKTAYDVFQYIAEITQSRWTTRMINENEVAIDFFDPLMEGIKDTIESTEQYYENNNIVDISFNYSTNDYRNKQIMTSDAVIGSIIQSENKVSDGYNKTFILDNNIGYFDSITINGVLQSVITKAQKELGYDADFVFTPGENTIVSSNTITAGVTIIFNYYPIVRGREIIINPGEITRIASQTNRNGAITRYENRNDTTSSIELAKIGQSYIKYKGNAEITLKIITTKDLFNVGDLIRYDSLVNDLDTIYMVKTKTIDMYIIANEIFYTYELTSNFNSENAINYFDNQRAKINGNLGEGETITRDIDLENIATIIFYDTEIRQTTIENPTSLDFELNGVLI